jgi:tryptophan-rich sensory protein
MNIPIIYAVGSCLAGAVAEGVLMGKDGRRFMDSLKQPRCAPPLWTWSLIGAAYYSICGVAIYRLTSRTAPSLWAISLVGAVIAANALWNYIYFRRRDLRLVFWYSVVYALLVIALIAVLIPADPVAAAAFGFYAAYLPYALTLFYRTWKLNV